MSECVSGTQGKNPLVLDSSFLLYFITSCSIGFMAPKSMGTYFYGKAQ